MHKLLIVEDDLGIILGLTAYLEKNQFQVITANNLEEAKLRMLNEGEISLVLLDLDLPDGTGYEFCEFLNRRNDTPIIFLTVCDEEEQVVKGLDLGADDYITKPFKLNILLSRIQAVLRRTGKKSEKQNFLSCQNIKLDQHKQYVYLNEERVGLTVGEYRLLYILLSNKNHTLTRKQLLEKLWDENEQYVNDNTLTVTMKRLREKLEHPSFIKTVRGVGYLVEDYEFK